MPEPGRALVHAGGGVTPKDKEEQRRRSDRGEPRKGQGDRDGSAHAAAPGDVDVAHDTRDLSADTKTRVALVVFEQLYGRKPRGVSGLTLVAPQVARRLAGVASVPLWTSGLTGAALVAVARAELEATLGVTAAPRLARVARWERAMPQYELGHPERVGRVQRLLGGRPWLALAGNGYTGVGIPEDQRAQVFETFHRVHPECYRGTGLGLAIVRRAVERCGGTIEVRDNPGGGTVFEVRLPAGTPAVAAAPPTRTVVAVGAD